jgi:predicted Zn-dependent peptidase
MGNETGNVSARCLSEHLPQVMKLVHDVLLEPGFRTDKLDLIKKQRKEQMLRQKDYPGWIIGTLFNSKIYGDHPYGRISRSTQIDSITQADIMEAYRNYVNPDRAYIAISGDINTADVMKQIKKLFGDWESTRKKLPEIQKVSKSIAPGYYMFEKDINQTHIRLGHLSIKRGNPDEYALVVMNTILGGEAFKSRLATRIRSDEGLAYSAGSRYGTGSLEPSAFFCRSQTRSEKTFRTITIMKETMQEMRDTLPTVDEMDQAKQTLINSFIHKWTDTRYALQQIMNLEIQSYPDDYYREYTAHIQKVTREDVQRVAAKYLDPENVVIVLIGKRSEMTDLPPDINMKAIELPPEYMK